MFFIKFFAPFKIKLSRFKCYLSQGDLFNSTIKPLAQNSNTKTKLLDKKSYLKFLKNFSTVRKLYIIKDTNYLLNKIKTLNKH